MVDPFIFPELPCVDTPQDVPSRNDTVRKLLSNPRLAHQALLR